MDYWLLSANIKDKFFFFITDIEYFIVHTNFHNFHIYITFFKNINNTVNCNSIKS